jgi:hypothetical protein
MNNGTKTLPAFAIPNLEVTQDISMHSEQGPESIVLPWLHRTVSKQVTCSVCNRFLTMNISPF